jgi:hypothetical protein
MPEITSDNTNAPTILAEDSDDQFREWINKFKTKFTIYRVNDSYKITVEMNGENDLRLCFHIRVKNEKNPNVIDNKLLVNLKKLRAEKTYSDFKFIVERKEFPGHKSLLSIRSDVFVANLKIRIDVVVVDFNSHYIVDKRLLTDLQILMNDKQYSDFKFIVGDKVFPVHKSSLYSFECIRGYV